MKLAGQIIFPVILLLLAFSGFKALKNSKEPLKSKVPPAITPQVEVVEISPSDYAPPLRSFGTVQSYFESTLTPQVSGDITEVSDSFRVGITVAKGEILARIDDVTYKAALADAEANLANSKRTLAEEQIRVDQASADWLASGRSLSKASDFVLRKPQLAAARADIASAEAAVEKAKTDLENTTMRAPYDAIVLERTASIGNLANIQQAIGKLVASEKAEVRLPLTADQMARLNLPSGTASKESIAILLTNPAQPNSEWSAQLVRKDPSIDPQNQVSYVIAEIDQPYTGQAQALPVGTFVNASIPSKPLVDVYEITSSALVNDLFVWAVDSDNKLRKLDAKRMQSFESKVFIDIETDLDPPLVILTRPLTNFREGDEVKVLTGEDTK
ncbi:MAG: efflux RND transporter periplasmic adaptor subunit [Akkermansiaceae bacterium]